MIAIRLNPCIIFSKAGLHFGTDGIPLSRLAAAEVYEEDVCVPHHGCAGPILSIACFSAMDVRVLPLRIVSRPVAALRQSVSIYPVAVSAISRLSLNAPAYRS